MLHFYRHRGSLPSGFSNTKEAYFDGLGVTIPGHIKYIGAKFIIIMVSGARAKDPGPCTCTPLLCMHGYWNVHYSVLEKTLGKQVREGATVSIFVRYIQ